MAAGEIRLELMEGMSPGPCAMAIGLFGLIRVLAAGRESTPRLARFVKASFCVYLIHHFFVMIFRHLGVDTLLFAPIASIPLESAAILALSLAGWWVLEKIPFVKKYLI